MRVLVSRCDRIGDLLLSLPALGLLRDAGCAVTLHTSPYARTIGEWARHNQLCESLNPQGRYEAGLSLFHCPEAVAALRGQPSLGPRTKLSALWSYTKSIAQHRSRVEKSEMEYNLDLARAFLRWRGLAVPDFRGLPPLRVPWTSPRPSPDLVLNVSNRGSATNWPIERYIELARDRRARGQRVEFLVSGIDAAERVAALEQAGEHAIVKDFPSLENLVAYLAGAREVISSSTGPLHIAHAAGVKVTGIYPRLRVQSFKRWRPDGYWHKGAVSFLEI